MKCTRKGCKNTINRSLSNFLSLLIDYSSHKKSKNDILSPVMFLIEPNAAFEGSSEGGNDQILYVRPNHSSVNMEKCTSVASWVFGGSSHFLTVLDPDLNQ